MSFIEKEPCDNCGKRPWSRARGTDNGTVFLCKKCPDPVYTGAPYIKDTVFLKDYGNASKARVNELDARVILPYDHPGGSYYLGRKNKFGKIQEKEPVVH